MTVALTLGLPPRTPEHPLLAGLLDDASGAGGHPGLVHGAPVRLASAPTPTDPATGVAVLLDVDPERLPAALRTRPGAVRHEVAPARADLPAALALRPAVPLVVLLEPGPGLAADLAAVLAAGHRPGLPAGLGEGDAADALAVLAHAEVACLARAGGAGEVLALLAATAAALRGADVRAAWRDPDVAALARLSDAAGSAVREVLGSVEVDDPVAVAAGLAAAGLTVP